MFDKFTRRGFLTWAIGLASSQPGLVCYRALANTVSTGPNPIRGGVVRLPRVVLRGYGGHTADYRTLTGASGPASLLRIRCDTPQKALLTQAKYLSDAEQLPGTESLTLTTTLGKLSARRVQGSGALAACAVGKEVLIFTASSEQDIAELIAQHTPPGSTPSDFLPRATVPMFLDRWDRYGLLAYYGPFTIPPGKQDDYDFDQDFAFATSHGPLGLVAWDNETANDTAEGLMNVPLWDWIAAECLDRRLPLHINTQAGAALWLTNRFRDETMQKAPQYCGTYYHILDPNIAEQGYVSWNAGRAADVELGVLQQSVRRFAGLPNIVGWLEPHSETDSPPQSLLVEYGRVADGSYRRFLKERYVSLADLSAAWYGDRRALTSWDEVRVPELAEFLGWRPDALDMIGEWRVRPLAEPDVKAIAYDGGPALADPSLHEWYQPGFDDRSWGTLRLPGNDRQMFLPPAPAMLRRFFDVSSDWLASHPRVWLYLWDLTEIHGDPYPIYINGRKAPDMPAADRIHWGAVEVTGLLRAGRNFLALRLPKGTIAYRFYLSPHPPNQYPHLGPAGNARWADFSDWVLWSRGQAIRRGAEMIRQVDADRQINFMAPNFNAGVIKRVCEDYGGQFHDTGSMAGFWNDLNVLLMNGSGLPSTAEPGNGASELGGRGGFWAFWGRWLTEGIQGVHYFQHLGDILWNPDILKDFEANRSMYQMVGKYHVPFAEIAVLYSLRSAHSTGWPWGYDPNTNMTGGYWAWNTGFTLLNYCPRDGVTEEDFEDGRVNKYRVIVDSNTSIMSRMLIDRIETWVRRGGTFITFAQTGRHTVTEPNSWPISRLTGYDVTHIDRYGAGNQPLDSHLIRLAPGQEILQSDPWSGGVSASGLSLRKGAPDCQDLLLWEDGSVAVGVRKLGAGRIFHLGAHFETLNDRTDSPHTLTLLSQLLEPMSLERVPGEAPGVMMRHYITNNGLQDVWVVFNDSDHPKTTDLLFRSPLAPRRCVEVKTGREATVSLADGRYGLRGLNLASYETRMFLTPRPTVERGSLEWLSVQRRWWRASKTPSSRPLPTPAEDQRNSIDLCEDWAFCPVDGLSADLISALALPLADDTSWERIRPGIWTRPGRRAVKHAVLRRWFTVPAHWSQDGLKQLWVQSWSGSTFRDVGRVFLDGMMIQDFRSDGVAGKDVTVALQPGTKHLLVLEIKGRHALCGMTGSSWVYHYPEPYARQDLGGEWTVTRDGLHNTGAASLPGPVQALFAEREVLVDAAHAQRSVLLYIATDGPVHGVLINGRMIARHHHHIGPNFALNLTPLVRFGETNRVELICRSPDNPITISTVELRFYDPGVYP